MWHITTLQGRQLGLGQVGRAARACADAALLERIGDGRHPLIAPVTDIKPTPHNTTNSVSANEQGIDVGG